MSLISTQANFGGRQPNNTSYTKQFVVSPAGSFIEWVFKTRNSIKTIEPSVTNTTIKIPQNLEVGGNLTVYGTISNPSDRALKTNIVPLSPVTNYLGKLNPTQYNLIYEQQQQENNNTKAIESPLHYGFIAQELEEELPNLVKTLEDGTKTVNYIEIIPLLVCEMKCMKDEIIRLQKIVSELENANKRR